MAFIISNKPLLNSIRKKDIFIFGNFVENNSNLLVFKGFAYPEQNLSTNEILNLISEKGINFISEIKGLFCGIYYDKEENDLYFFSDKYGNIDLFYYWNDDKIIISDNFTKILQEKNFSLKDIEIQSIYEFLYFEFPLFERTFIKHIKFVPIGTIFKINMNTLKFDAYQYSDYRFKIKPEIDPNSYINKLDNLLDKATKRIKALNTQDTNYGLGLSGGFDSRLVAFYALKNKLNIKTFIFGEKGSDAYYISRKIAKKLNLEHYELGFQRDFFRYSDYSMKYNPMMNVLYTWYYSNSKNLPELDVLLTGYNGDNQFGSHLNDSDLSIKNHQEFVKKILLKYCEIRPIQVLKKYCCKNTIRVKIFKDIEQFSKKSINKKFWQKKEEFNYKYRQRIYIKNNPSFDFLGLYNSYSFFTDLDLMEFLLTIPFGQRLRRKLFFEFLRKKYPFLLKIRADRSFHPIYSRNLLINWLYKEIYKIDRKFNLNIIFKKSHKLVWQWLSNYDPFSNYLNECFKIENELFDNIFDRNLIYDLISKKLWTRSEFYLLFRFLTIKLFLDSIKLNLFDKT